MKLLKGICLTSYHSCHLIVAVLTGLFHKSWATHTAAGWAACALVWVFAIGTVVCLQVISCSMSSHGRWICLQLSAILGDLAHGFSLLRSGRSAFVVKAYPLLPPLTGYAVLLDVSGAYSDKSI